MDEILLDLIKGKHMKKITTEELKDIQLNMMDYVDRFCRNNNVQYTLASGTLLGAMRHGGYIPWDDDIDIHLLRSEYEKFTSLWNSKKDHYPYELVNIESGNNMGYPFGKIHDLRTVTYIGNVERTGVFIDVFPIDYVIDQKDLEERHKTIAKLYKKRQRAMNCMVINCSTSSVPLLKRLYALIMKPKASYNDIALEIAKLAQTVNYRTDYVFEIVCGFIRKNAVPTKVYEEYCDVKFEDRLYRRVKDFDTLLTKSYGDWRTPPPVEKRITHHGFIAYWKESI